MLETQVRAFEAGDSLAELTALVHRAYAKLASEGMCYWASHQSEADTAKRVAHGECLVAVVGEKLVGTILLWPPSVGDGCDWYARKDVASVHQFGVDPCVSGYGVGSRLLLAVEQRAFELGAKELALDTAESATRLIRMYNKRGYRFVEQVTWDKTNYRSCVLSKPLQK